MKQTTITIFPIKGGYIPTWCGRVINAPTAPISALRSIEVREIVPAAVKIRHRRHFRIWAEGPEGAFGWDIVPRPTQGADCVLAVSKPNWGEFISALRVGPMILCKLNEKKLDRISSRFSAAIGIPGGINIYPSPAAVWEVSDEAVVVHVVEPGAAWYRAEVIDIEPGLYRAKRIKGEVLRK